MREERDRANDELNAVDNACNEAQRKLTDQETALRDARHETNVAQQARAQLEEQRTQARHDRDRQVEDANTIRQRLQALDLDLAGQREDLRREREALADERQSRRTEEQRHAETPSGRRWTDLP